MKNRNKTREELIIELERLETENRQIKKTLLDSQGTFHALFDRSHDCLYVIDFVGKFIDANPASLNLLGYDREDIRNLTLVSILDPEDIPKAMQSIDDLLQSGSHKEVIEFRLKRKDGEYVYVEAKAFILYDNGKPFACMGIARDITERKRSEAILWESEERYRLSFENTSDVIFTIDRDLKVTSVSSSVKKILGYEPEEIIGFSVEALTNIVAPESMETAISNTIETLNGESNPGVVHTFIAKDGTRKIGEVSSSPLIRDGMIVGATAIARDITDRKQAEDALRLSESKYSTLVEQALEA